MLRAFRLPLAVAALAAVSLGAASAADGQDPAHRSPALAKELVELLAARKLESIAARDPIERDRFIAALVYPGQLMVVSGRYTVPVLLDEKISFEKYMDVYVALNGAAVPESKVFIEDQFADGLAYERKQLVFDSLDEGGRSILFNGDHRAAKMSKEDYARLFTETDERYAKLLELLLQQLKATKG